MIFWLLDKNYTNMSCMFSGCENLTNLKTNKDTYEFLIEKEIFTNKDILKFE